MLMTDDLWKALLHFKPSEFASPAKMQWDLLVRLDRMRIRAGIPLVITSSYRSPERNDAVGGADDSAHMRGYAVDIRCNTSRNRFRVLRAAYLENFNRIGVYATHVHVDCDPSLVGDVTWGPKDWTA